MKKKELKKTKKVKEVAPKSDPANYVVVSNFKSDWMLYSFYGGNGTDVNYFADLRDVATFVKKLERSTEVRVFKVAEEIKVKSKLELDL
jgi:hypothetical protein